MIHKMIQKSQKRTPIYKCEICIYNTCVFNNYKRHIDSNKHKLLEMVKKDTQIIVSNNRSFNCKKCDYNCSRLNDIIKHIHIYKHKVAETNIEKIVYTCMICNKIYKYKSGLSRHMKQKHIKNVETKRQNTLFNSEILNETQTQQIIEKLKFLISK